MDRAIAVIRKQGSQWCIYSKAGKKLSCHSSEAEAKKRLGEIEHFKKAKSQENPARGPQKPTDGKTKTKKKKSKKPSYGSEADMAEVKDPNAANPSLVPEVKTPTLENTGRRKEVYAALWRGEAAETDDATRQRVMADLITDIDKKMEKLAEAKALAERLLADGVTGDEFAKMASWMQQEVLGELMYVGVKAAKSERDQRVLETVARNRRS